MVGVIVAVVVAVSSLWVYLDASAHKIGKRPDVKAFFNMSAGEWATITLLFWIVGFPAYVAKRHDLIEAAKTNPSPVTHRAAKAVVLMVIGVLWVFLQFVVAVTTEIQTAAPSPAPLAYQPPPVAPAELPACNSPDAIALAEQILNNVEASATIVRLMGPTQVDFDFAAQVRICTGTIPRRRGRFETVTYKITWQDRSIGYFLVQFVE